MAINIPPESETRTKKQPRAWCAQRLLTLISDQIKPEVSEQAAELIQKRRLLDFMVQPGRVTAKVQDELGKAHRVEIFFRQFSDKDWEIILERLTEQAYFLALMLSGRVPQELEDILNTHQLQLFPPTFSQLRIAYDGSPAKVTIPAIAAVLQRLCDKLDSDPFSIFIIKGRGREETIAEIRKRRSMLNSMLNQRQHLRQDIVSPPADSESAPPLDTTIDYFWSSGERLLDISYSIRADELPASILKWLDPPPLAGLEEDVDSLLEESYERIARLAQAFGLRL